MLEILQNATKQENRTARSLTVSDICRETKIDKYYIELAITELTEIDKTVAQTGDKTVYEPDGNAIYLALYSAV